MPFEYINNITQGFTQIKYVLYRALYTLRPNIYNISDIESVAFPHQIIY